MLAATTTSLLLDLSHCAAVMLVAPGTVDVRVLQSVDMVTISHHGATAILLSILLHDATFLLGQQNAHIHVPFAH